MSIAGTFDYIVIGAGSAGCALAARLSESGKHNVLLLEAGERDRSIWIHLPLGVGKLLNNERYVWRFFSDPQPQLQGKKVYSPRGRVLGGSSSINGMAYIWGEPAEFDHWSALGNRGWGWDDVQPYFQRLEMNPYSDHPKRGRSGPVYITDRKVRDRDALSDAFVAGCLDAGIPETPDYNAVSYEGVRYLEQTARNGWRCSTASAYLRNAERRESLKIETEALVTRILFDGTRATGVEYLQRGERRIARAAREVLLTAGAIKTPQILELSGVGNGERLRALGVPVVLHSPHVGEHMSDHLQVRRTYETDLPITINDVMRSTWHRMRFGLQFVLTRKGLLAGTSSTAHAITRTSPELDRPDVMVRIYHISGADRFSRSVEAGIDGFSGFSIGGFQVRPKSRGYVHAMSPDPRADPAIQPNYFTDPEDRRTAVDLLRLIRRIAEQPAMKQRIVAERRPGTGLPDDDAALLDYARECAQTAWHTVGSCRMGVEGDGVVDERLRVRGVAGLRVVDASVMPTIPSSNTNAACIMVGERGADFVLEDAR